MMLLKIYMLIGLIGTPISLLVNNIIYDNMNWKGKKFVDNYYEKFSNLGDLSCVFSFMIGASVRWAAWPICLISGIWFAIDLFAAIKEES